MLNCHFNFHGNRLWCHNCGYAMGSGQSWSGKEAFIRMHIFPVIAKRITSQFIAVCLIDLFLYKFAPVRKSFFKSPSSRRFAAYWLDWIPLWIQRKVIVPSHVERSINEAVPGKGWDSKENGFPSHTSPRWGVHWWDSVRGSSAINKHGNWGPSPAPIKVLRAALGFEFPGHSRSRGGALMVMTGSEGEAEDWLNTDGIPFFLLGKIVPLGVP